MYDYNEMKDSTKEILLREMSKPTRGKLLYRVAKELFIKYAGEEIDSIEHITSILHNEFREFIKENRERLDFSYNDCQWREFLRDIDRYLNYIDKYKETWFKYMLTEHDLFADLVVHIMQNLNQE